MKAGLSRPLRTHIALLALLAMLGVACFPSIARLLGPSSERLIHLSLCSPDGADRSVVFDLGAGGDNKPSQSPRLDTGDCPFCVTHVALGMPPIVLAAVPAGDLSDGLPDRFYTAQRPLFAWTAAHPRGPPAA